MVELGFAVPEEPAAAASATIGVAAGEAILASFPAASDGRCPLEGLLAFAWAPGGSADVRATTVRADSRTYTEAARFWRSHVGILKIYMRFNSCVHVYKNSNA